MNRDDTGVRMEIVELPATAHPFFFGTQYHPEVRLSPRPFHFQFIRSVIMCFASSNRDRIDRLRRSSALSRQRRRNGNILQLPVSVMYVLYVCMHIPTINQTNKYIFYFRRHQLYHQDLKCMCVCVYVCMPMIVDMLMFELFAD